MSESIGNGMNYLCPKCKKGDSLTIDIVVTCNLVPDGTDIDGQDHEWDENSKAGCNHCDFVGHVSDFIKLEEGEGSIVICADCDTEFYENQTDSVDNPSERFLTGDTFTEHQCPSCGALCFPL